MKRFLKTVLLFCSPIVLVFASIEMYLSSNTNTELSLKSRLLRSSAPEIKTLVLGSSQSYYGINPDAMTKPGFNAAYVSQDLTTDLAILQKHLPSFEKLETVVLPINYLSLRWNIPNSREPFRTIEYLKTYGLRRSWNPKDNLYVFAYKPNLLFTRMKVQYQKPSMRDVQPSGFLPRKSIADSVDLKSMARITLERHDLSDHSVSQNKNAIKAIVKICKSHNLQLVLLITPTTPEYYNGIKSSQWNEVLEFTDSLQKREEIVLLNLMKSDRFVRTDFFDADHLAKSGAEKLSAILDSTIEFSVK